MGSIWLFLADLLFMGFIFAGMAFLIRYILHQTVGTMNEPIIKRSRELIPHFEKHQEHTQYPS